MYHEVGLDALSKKQVSKLLNGHPVRVKVGGSMPAFVSAEHLKKLTKAGMKGCGITVSLDPYAIAKNQHLRKAVGMLGRGTGRDVAKALGNAAIAGTDAASARLVRALEGSGLYGRGTGHDVAKALGNAAIAGTDAASARLVRALEGSGIGHKKHRRPRKIVGMRGSGKQSSTEQFRDWTKNIGQVFKPLNRGALGAAKRQVIGAAGNAISNQISTQGNPYGMSSSNVPVQQTRYQMRTAKIDARPQEVSYGQDPVYATPIYDNQTYASPDDYKSLGLPPLPSGAYDDSYEIPIGQLYGSGLKKRGRGIKSNVNKVVGLVSMAEKAMGRGLKHLRPKRVMSEAQKAALAKGRHNLRLKLEEMGAGVKKHHKTPKHLHHLHLHHKLEEMGEGVKKHRKTPKHLHHLHLHHKHVMSEAQKEALAKGRHNLRLKLEEMGEGVKKHRKHRKGGSLMPAGGALLAAGY